MSAQFLVLRFKGFDLGTGGGIFKRNLLSTDVNTLVLCKTHLNLLVWMVHSLVVRAARGLEYGGREFESRSLHLKPETKLREERGLSGCRKGLKTVPLAQALLSLKQHLNLLVIHFSICYNIDDWYDMIHIIKQ